MQIRVSMVLYGLGFASIVASAMNYLSGKTELGSGKERTGLFVGQWPPTFFILGKIVEDWENQASAEEATANEGTTEQGGAGTTAVQSASGQGTQSVPHA